MLVHALHKTTKSNRHTQYPYLRRCTPLHMSIPTGSNDIPLSIASVQGHWTLLFSESPSLSSLHVSRVHCARWSKCLTASRSLGQCNTHIDRDRHTQTHILLDKTHCSTKHQDPQHQHTSPIDWTRAEPQRIVEKSTLPLTAPCPHSRRLRAIVHWHPIVSIPAAAYLSGTQRHRYILCVSVTADTSTTSSHPAWIPT